MTAAENKNLSTLAQDVLLMAQEIAPELEFYRPHEYEGIIFLDSDVLASELEIDGIDELSSLKDIEDAIYAAL